MQCSAVMRVIQHATLKQRAGWVIPSQLRIKVRNKHTGLRISARHVTSWELLYIFSGNTLELPACGWSTDRRLSTCLPEKRTWSWYGSDAWHNTGGAVWSFKRLLAKGTFRVSVMRTRRFIFNFLSALLNCSSDAHNEPFCKSHY